MRRLAKHHAIPRQQLLRHRMTPLRRRCSIRRKRRPIQRPPSLRRRRSRPPRPKNRLLIHPSRRLPRTTRRPLTVSPQRSHAIVRQHPSPHQAPQRLQRLSRIPAAHAIMQILKERSPMPLQILNNRHLLAHFRRRSWHHIPLVIPQNSLNRLRRSNRPKQTASPPDKAQSAHPARQSDPTQPRPPRPPQSTYPDPQAYTPPTAPAESPSPESKPAAEPPADSQSHPAAHPARAAAAPHPAIA